MTEHARRGAVTAVDRQHVDVLARQFGDGVSHLVGAAGHDVAQAGVAREDAVHAPEVQPVAATVGVADEPDPRQRAGARRGREERAAIRWQRAGVGHGIHRSSGTVRAGPATGTPEDPGARPAGGRPSARLPPAISISP